MSIGVLYSGAWFFVLVNTHPLIQNIQPYPVSNHQQHAYQPSYSDVLMVLPNNINHYSQPLSIQTPVVTYHTLQAPSLMNEVPQIYWDKPPASPLLKVLDANKVLYDQYGKDVQTNLKPYNTGGVVNNYIIVPPDYLQYNETVAKEPTSKRVRNELRPVKKKVTSNQRKRKMSNNKKGDIKDVKSPNIKTSRIDKQNKEPSWNFNTDNIKCFTPADILENEKYQPEKEIVKNKERKNQCDRKCNKRNSKSNTNCANKDRSEKSTKKKKNKVKKKSTENGKNECKEKIKNISPLNTTHEKTKKRKKSSKVCKCARQENLPDFETKILEDIPIFCDQDIDDLLLSHLLQQDCTNLENRHTRNSKTDAAKKDSRNIYLDLPSDTSWNWYMNDLYSPQSLQDALNSNLFQGNKYPFDFTQIYQIPQYSSADVKSNGNTERNKNTRRKKNKKKKKKNPRKENASNGDDSNHSLISDSEIQISETNIEIPDTSSQVSDIGTNFSEKSTDTSPESKIKVATLINENYQDEFTLVSPNNVTAETVYTSPVEKVTVHFKEPVLPLEEFPQNTNLKTLDQNLKSEENDSKEIYETQIPISIVEQLDNGMDKIMDDRLPILDSHIYSQLPELGTEDEMFNMFLNDYYPDFRADNLAYLVSDEEVNYHNVHDRYFYVTDKNLDSREIYTSEHFNQHSNKGALYTDDEKGNYNVGHNEHKVQEKDKSQEIVFRTPPGLEVPDFRTRKINSDIQGSTEIYYDHNNYEKYFDSIADKSNNFIKTDKREDNHSEHLVETVYARSKVVKFGPGQELDKSSKQEAKINFSALEDSTIQNSGNTTIVVAKSLRPVDVR